jgi:hypothetical protein
MAVGQAVLELSRDPAAMQRTAEKWMPHNAILRDMVQRAGGKLTREDWTRFMLSEAAFDWGRLNQAPVMTGALGHLFFALHGFQTRYLANMSNLMRNMGPEGRLASAWMLGTLAMGAGAMGLPFLQDGTNAADYLYQHATGTLERRGRDPMLIWRAQAALRAGLETLGATDHLARLGTLVAFNGVPAIMGAPLTERIGFGDIISRELEGAQTGAEMLGTAPSIVLGRVGAAARRFASGQGAGAAATELLPSAPRHALQAIHDYARQPVTQTGYPYPGVGTATTAEAVSEGLGLEPTNRALSWAYENWLRHAKASHLAPPPYALPYPRANRP